jgi:predicted PurR-regulated permease PerM
VGAKTLGILGVFLAVPIAVVLTALLQEIAMARQQPVEQALPEQPTEQAQTAGTSPRPAPVRPPAVPEKN